MVNSFVGLMLFFVVGLAHAQVVVVAVDDSFGISFGKLLEVESLGVLKNDTLDGETDKGLTAELITDVADGTLTCPDDGALKLCADGSFDYVPGTGFNGIDSFTYRAVFETTVSAPATVTLTACKEVKPQIFSCWKESSYRAKLTELGYGTFVEGFEGAAWDSVRPPNSAPEIISQGISWTSNHLATNNITTGTGPARTPVWGAYDPSHGFATGTLGECVDVEPVPQECLYHDGLSGKILTGSDSLHGVGGYITGSWGANVAIILDEAPENQAGYVKFGKIGSGHQFLGVINATGSGFSGFELRELDGQVGQQLFLWADDFILADSSVCIATGYVIPADKWTRFALPCDTAPNSTVGDIFDGLVPGDYGNTWVVYRRDASTPEYIELDIADKMTEVTGYWVISANATTVEGSGLPQTFTDIDLVGVDGGRDNYVGHNQDVSVDWNKVQVVDGGAVYNHGEYDLLMEPIMYKWNGNVYLMFDGDDSAGSPGALDPFDGFWVRALQAGIKLRIPVVAAGSVGGSVATSSPVDSFMSTEGNGSKRPQKIKKPKKPKSSTWYIRLTATSGDMEDPGNVLGQMDTATEGNDPHDLEEPAPFGDKYLSILFTNPLFEQLNWGFTTDFRAMTKHPRGVWPFVVKTHAGSREVTIRWEGKDELFKDAWLVDEENGEFIQAKAGESYTFEIEGGEHHFRFEVGE